MLQNSLTARENYLWFADNNYLAARLLILNRFYIPGISVAQQAVEQYLKLKIYELVDRESIKKTKIENCHNLVKLFKTVQKPMKINNLSLKEINHYLHLLTLLNNAYRFRYFDEKGVLGELNKGKSVALGFTFEDLDRFDELSCELRNSVFIKGQGGCPVNEAYKDKLFFKKTTIKGEIMHQNNKQYGKFKIRGQTMIEFYSRFR